MRIFCPAMVAARSLSSRPAPARSDTVSVGAYLVPLYRTSEAYCLAHAVGRVAPDHIPVPQEIPRYGRSLTYSTPELRREPGPPQQARNSRAGAVNLPYGWLTAPYRATPSECHIRLRRF